MSDDEIVVLAASAGIAVFAWAAWYWRQWRIRRLRRPAAGRWVLQLTPAAAAAILFAVLRIASAHDVRDDPRYLTLYFLLGATWIGLSAVCLPLVGLSPRDDAMERANRAAAYATAGALLAMTFCYAGGNIGDGPGWWVVVFSAALATAALFLTWLVFELVTRVSETVTIDRDAAAGLRLAGFLVACGLVFGRAVAGDWISVDVTVRDFLVVARPVVILLAAAVLLERVARPTPDRPEPSMAAYGMAPALVYVVAAAWYVIDMGLPA